MLRPQRAPETATLGVCAECGRQVMIFAYEADGTRLCARCHAAHGHPEQSADATRLEEPGNGPDSVN